ncbi:DinB family protein [Promicromonospora sp. NPDC019610]|uniref:DinB family protein n=1 Tax=Promicromonospora sp. NPDC019610 TaxID=3364405 RepID=UPI0037993840
MSAGTSPQISPATSADTGPGTSEIPRADPPLAADEVTMLRSFVDFYRATIRRQCAGLTAEQLRTPHPPSTMTLAGMLKHLAYVEDFWFSVRLLGNDPAPPWDTVDWSADRDWDWNSALTDSPERLTALFDGAVAASERILDEAVGQSQGLDQEVARPAGHAGHGGRVTLRWILVHMVEEYSRHAGHADLLREALDGATDL